MKEHYSPSEFKQNTWEYDDDGEEDVHYTPMDEAYNSYYRTYTWDLDDPLPRKEFEKRLREDEDFAAVWGPRDA
jgi:hypothetical protein